MSARSMDSIFKWTRKRVSRVMNKENGRFRLAATVLNLLK